MMERVQYITNEQGEQVGVLLNMDTYRRLMADLSSDPEILHGLSQSELEALSVSKLVSSEQARLDALLEKNKKTDLDNSEQAELDHLLEQIDQLTILRTRASYTLQKSKSSSKKQ